MGRLLLAATFVILTMLVTSHVVSAADADQSKVIATGCKTPQWPADQKGHVVLRLLIAPDGSILERDIAFSSGNANLDQEILDAYSQCRFLPNPNWKEPQRSFIYWPAPPTVNPLRACRPAWPPGAREAGERGTALVAFKIDENGNVIDRKLIQSSGHADLDTVTLDAFAKCSFKRDAQLNPPGPIWIQRKYTWNPS